MRFAVRGEDVGLGVQHAVALPADPGDRAIGEPGPQRPQELGAQGDGERQHAPVEGDQVAHHLVHERAHDAAVHHTGVGGVLVGERDVGGEPSVIGTEHLQGEPDAVARGAAETAERGFVEPGQLDPLAHQPASVGAVRSASTRLMSRSLVIGRPDSSASVAKS